MSEVNFINLFSLVDRTKEMKQLIIDIIKGRSFRELTSKGISNNFSSNKDIIDYCFSLIGYDKKIGPECLIPSISSMLRYFECGDRTITLETIDGLTKEKNEIKDKFDSNNYVELLETYNSIRLTIKMLKLIDIDIDDLEDEVESTGRV